MKILIVDDDLVNRFYLRELLSDDYELAEAKNGVETLEKLKTFKADVVLLDIMMPVMDGIETLINIRKNEITKDINVIMISAKVEKDDVVQAIKLGANDYLKKPVDQIELLAKLDIQKKYIENKKTIAEYQVYANIKESMMVAQRLQKSLLPDKKTFNNLFAENFVLNLPKDIVSGDFYNIFRKANKKIITLFDSVGHGVPASMMSIIIHLTILKYIEGNNYSNISNLINNIICDFQINLNHSNDTFFEFGFDGVFCEIDETNKILTFIGARRPLILIRKNIDYLIVNNQKMEPFMVHQDYFLFNILGDAFSISVENKIFNTKIIEYKSNDNIYLFSDGYHDQTFGDENKRISKRGFYKLLIEKQDYKMLEQKTFFYNNIKKNTNELPQIDDILLIGINL